jgi:NAD(P)-dependent dehydrogenase (short-subunit alcohol dehydrogenase family)
VLSYRGSKSEAEATVADVQARGRQAIAVAADVSKAADCAALVAAADTAFGRVDVLVNMASVYGSNRSTSSPRPTSTATWRSTSSRRSCARSRRFR